MENREKAPYLVRILEALERDSPGEAMTAVEEILQELSDRLSATLYGMYEMDLPFFALAFRLAGENMFSRLDPVQKAVYDSLEPVLALTNISFPLPGRD